MIIHSASQLLTISDSPQRGRELGKLGLIENGAVLIRDGLIAEIGKSQDILAAYPSEARLDANNHVVMPGFVDPHTHLPWVGDRANEFESRLMGKSYLDIMADGGGIKSTVLATRSSTGTTLQNETRLRARAIFNHGTTTAEAKSGYGLTWESELRLLDTLMLLNDEGPLEIIPTFLGAHAFPSEYEQNHSEYVQLICKEMLPNLVEHWRCQYPGLPFPFVDVFCDEGAFTYKQTNSIFKAASQLGFLLKVHADEFANLGAVRLAVQHGAISADHLVKSSQADIQALSKSKTIAVSLPCTPFGLVHNEYTPAKEFITSDALFALASDLNPGTAWSGNMQFVIALACRYMSLTPAQAIVASTINAAAAISRADHIGSLTPGKQADLIILNVIDYRHLAYRFGINQVSHVIKKGRIYPVQ